LNHKNTPAGDVVKFNGNGIPICPLGLAMSHWGYNKDRCRIKWRCPISASKKMKEKFGECPVRDVCSRPSYGRVVYTYPESNPRLFTTPPRGSSSWKEIYTTGRSSAERGIKRILVDYQLERARVRSRRRWYRRILLAAVNIHLDAWLDYIRLNIVGYLTSWAEEAA